MNTVTFTDAVLYAELKNIWEDILQVQPIGLEDNFFDIGGTSLLGIQINSKIMDVLGIDLLNDVLLDAPTISELAQYILDNIGDLKVEQPSTLPIIFSSNNSLNSRASVEDKAMESDDFILSKKELTVNNEERFSPFPLTPIQEAYWIGRTNTFYLGGVSTHLYFEIDTIGLDLQKLNTSFQQLIDRHDMLRAIFLPDGQQQVLEKTPPYLIKHLDIKDKNLSYQKEQLSSLRQQMSHQVLPAEQWPLFDIRHASLEEGKGRLFLSFDALILDAFSKKILFQEWENLYHNPNYLGPKLELTFKDFVLHKEALRRTTAYKKALDQWKDRSKNLAPAPKLDLLNNTNKAKPPTFVRRTHLVNAADYATLKGRAKKYKLSLPIVLFSIYVQVIRLWSKEPAFTLNLTIFDRFYDHPQIDQILGDFTNTLLLECNFSNVNDLTFVSLANQHQRQFWKDLNNRLVSGVEVIREMTKTNDRQETIMPVVFTSKIQENNDSQDIYNWLGNITYSLSQTPQVWLDLVVENRDGGIAILWNSVDALFPQNMVSAMFEAYCKMLGQLIEEEDIWEKPLKTWHQIILPTDFQQQVIQLNSTKAQIQPQLLHQLFFYQSTQLLDKEAIITPELTLTYEELALRANQLGNYLREQTVQPNQIVAIVMEKGWEQVVAALGILASGAAYLPIDASLPKERIEYLLQNAAVEIVVTQSKFTQQLDWLVVQMKLVVIDSPLLLSMNTGPLDTIQQPEDLAYIIYTSGSTGHPKGVLIDHKGAVNTILDINQQFNISNKDSVLALSSLSFDLSVYDLFGLLAVGGTVIIPSASEIQNPAHWSSLIAAHKITIWNSVPALMSLLIDYEEGGENAKDSHLRLVLLSGDWIPLPLPDQIKALHTSTKVVSLGGATEASIWSIFYPIEAINPSWVSIPYGRPLSNQSFYVLNTSLETCPLWVSGDLYIGGIGLAKGYWRDSEKTKQHFISHPQTGERLYKTGDLGRYIPEGKEIVIEFLGRADFQVKIQGFRVELGEIESILLQHPTVRKCVVNTYGDKTKGKQLVAYVVGNAIDSAQLRGHLASKLPNYMIPSSFMSLEQLPLTINGKIDRKQLPIPKVEKLSTPILPIANNGTLHKIALLVKTILKEEVLTPNTNLISLGATSIDIIRMANLFEKELEYRPPIDEVYKNPTIVGLCQLYEKELLHQQQHQADYGLSGQVHPALSKLLAAPRLEIEKQASFKQSRHGIRKDLAEPVIQLPPISSKEESNNRVSIRQFSLKQIALEHLANLLSSMMARKVAGKHKFNYGSGGGLYPVQVYLYVKSGRVDNLEQGIYYYHPLDHSLHPINLHSTIDAAIYSRLVNRPIFEEAAFSIYLIAQLDAIAPIYREKSLHYATLEAGLMTQLLETTAMESGLGLCQIGTVDFYKVSELFKIEPSHVLIHSLVGGLIEQNTQAEEQQSNDQVDEKEWRLLQRIDQLSEEEADLLLKKLSEDE